MGSLLHGDDCGQWDVFAVPQVRAEPGSRGAGRWILADAAAGEGIAAREELQRAKPTGT